MGAMHSMGAMHPMGGGPRFATAPFATRAAFSPNVPHFGVHRPFFHHGLFHHRFHRFAFFFGAPYYADYGYDSCWQRVWTGRGPRWIYVCGDYGY